jgi:hypothetical protein
MVGGNRKAGMVICEEVLDVLRRGKAGGTPMMEESRLSVVQERLVWFL